jgi:hypothetical protein
MKMIRINGVEQSVQAETLNFEQFLTDLNKSLGTESQVISTIRVNGRELSEAEETQLKLTPVADIEDIEIETANPLELATRTLDTLDQYADRLIASVERAALHYEGKNFISGDTYFVKAIDGLDLFVQTIGGIKLALRIGLNPKVALAEASLVSIMNDLLEAKRNNNYIFMAELLKKDLVENLTEWRTTVFPMLKNWRAN